VTGRVDNAGTHVIASTAGAASVVRKLGTTAASTCRSRRARVGGRRGRREPRGSAMLVATVQSGSLDTLAPMNEGALDSARSTSRSASRRPRVVRTTLIGALGLDAATADRIGAHDDLASRFATPDRRWQRQARRARRRGLLARPPRRLRPDLGRPSTMVGRLLPGDAAGLRFSYRGTASRSACPKTYAMSGMTAATMMFEDPFYGASAGNSTPMVPRARTDRLGPSS